MAVRVLLDRLEGVVGADVVGAEAGAGAGEAGVWDADRND